MCIKPNEYKNKAAVNSSLVPLTWPFLAVSVISYNKFTFDLVRERYIGGGGRCGTRIGQALIAIMV